MKKEGIEFNKNFKIFRNVFLFVLFISVSSFFVVFAVEVDPPGLEDAQSVIERIFNIVFASVAGVLVAVIAYGIWKSSLAAGDPRGLEGAKQTWSYALYGFAVIILFFVIFAVAQRLLGIPVITPKQLLDNVFYAIESLVTTSTREGTTEYVPGGFNPPNHVME